MSIFKLLNQRNRQPDNQSQKRSRIFNAPLTIGAIVGISVVIMPFKAIGQCILPIANLNSSNYAIDNRLEGASNPTPTLSFFGGAMQFSALRTGTATWSLGIRVRNDAGVLVGNYLFLQPANAPDYLNTNNEVTYTLTFPIPLTSLSMVVAGLNNFDGTTVTASNGATSIPISAANFSALTPASPPAAVGMSILPPNTVIGSSTSGGTQVDTNSYLLTIPGPVTSVNIVSGKNLVSGNVATNTVTIGFTTFNICYATLSGTVFRDTDGSKLQDGGELGTNAGGLNAVLINSSNAVVATTAVAANGTYSFNNVVPGTYTVRITTELTSVITLPTGWVSTGENLNSTIDGGAADSIITVTVTPANITGINLGIEQRPTAVGGTAASQANPTGTNTVTVAPTLFTGSTDPDGTVASYRITDFPSNATSITINGTNYTSGTFPGGGVTVTPAQLAVMLVDPFDGAVTVGILFQVIDNAGQTSTNTATASLPFTATAATPNLLLVKRLTAINGVAINGFNNDPTTADDNPKWPTPATYLQGAFIRNDVRPSDILEYTIYFLSAGTANVTNVTICDLVPPQTTFFDNAYDIIGGGSGLGIGFASSTTALPTAPTAYLTNVFDGDPGAFYARGVNPPATCRNPMTGLALTATENTDGLIVVTKAILPFAQAPGDPTNSYGFVRFQVKVK